MSLEMRWLNQNETFKKNIFLIDGVLIMYQSNFCIPKIKGHLKTYLFPIFLKKNVAIKD